jgi:CDP-diacylglycerol--serine O-phosphatidyltransferase
MIAVIFVFGLVTVDPPRIFLIAFLIYAASGPVMQVLNWRKGSG